MPDLQAVESSSRPGKSERPQVRPGIPSSHHHLAYTTHDTRATIEFYTRVMGMPLVGAVIDDRIPSTKDPYTYLHTFFRMEDGACLAFLNRRAFRKRPRSSIRPIGFSIIWHCRCRPGQTSTAGLTGSQQTVWK